MEMSDATRPDGDPTETTGQPAAGLEDRTGLFALDGASANSHGVLDDVAAQRAIAADTTLPMEQRLEAFEDIVDSEVGDTQLIRARNIERQLGWRQLYLKFEGGNPTGTHKDRIAFAQAMDAMRRGYDVVTVATCGNYGVAMALACSLAGLRCVIYVPGSYNAKRLNEIAGLGAEIVRTPNDYEHAVQCSRERAETGDFYDANPGGANLTLQLQAYGQIAYEIYDELRDAPAVVAVPVSNGTTLAGVYRGFLSLYRRGKTSRIPRIVAGSSYRKNPIVEAFLKNKYCCDDLQPHRIRETAVNEPLINWQSIDGDHALAAIRATDGWAADVSDRSLLASARSIREREGLSVLPAATAGLNALVDRHRKTPFPGDRYVAVLTGRKA